MLFKRRNSSGANFNSNSSAGQPSHQSPPEIHAVIARGDAGPKNKPKRDSRSKSPFRSFPVRNNNAQVSATSRGDREGQRCRPNDGRAPKTRSRSIGADNRRWQSPETKPGRRRSMSQGRTSKSSQYQDSSGKNDGSCGGNSTASSAFWGDNDSVFGRASRASFAAIARERHDCQATDRRSSSKGSRCSRADNTIDSVARGEAMERQDRLEFIEEIKSQLKQSAEERNGIRPQSHTVSLSSEMLGTSSEMNDKKLKNRISRRISPSNNNGNGRGENESIATSNASRDTSKFSRNSNNALSRRISPSNNNGNGRGENESIATINASRDTSKFSRTSNNALSALKSSRRFISKNGDSLNAKVSFGKNSYCGEVYNNVLVLPPSSSNKCNDDHDDVDLMSCQAQQASPIVQASRRNLRKNQPLDHSVEQNQDQLHQGIPMSTFNEVKYDTCDNDQGEASSSSNRHYDNATDLPNGQAQQHSLLPVNRLLKQEPTRGRSRSLSRSIQWISNDGNNSESSSTLAQKCRPKRSKSLSHLRQTKNGGIYDCSISNQSSSLATSLKSAYALNRHLNEKPPSGFREIKDDGSCKVSPGSSVKSNVPNKFQEMKDDGLKRHYGINSNMQSRASNVVPSSFQESKDDGRCKISAGTHSSCDDSRIPNRSLGSISNLRNSFQGTHDERVNFQYSPGSDSCGHSVSVDIRRDALLAPPRVLPSQEKEDVILTLGNAKDDTPLMKSRSEQSPFREEKNIIEYPCSLSPKGSACFTFRPPPRRTLSKSLSPSSLEYLSDSGRTEHTASTTENSSLLASDQNSISSTSSNVDSHNREITVNVLLQSLLGGSDDFSTQSQSSSTVEGYSNYRRESSAFHSKQDYQQNQRKLSYQKKNSYPPPPRRNLIPFTRSTSADNHDNISHFVTSAVRYGNDEAALSPLSPNESKKDNSCELPRKNHSFRPPPRRSLSNPTRPVSTNESGQGTLNATVASNEAKFNTLTNESKPQPGSAPLRSPFQQRKGCNKGTFKAGGAFPPPPPRRRNSNF